MPLVCSHGVQLFFVHVPKTGGTSVEDYPPTGRLT